MRVAEENRYRFVIEALILLVLTGVGVIWMATAPLIPAMMAAYGVNRGTVSWSMSVVPIVMAVFALPAGVITTRIGLKKTFAVGVFLEAAGLLTLFSSNFVELLVTRLLFAVGAAMTFPVAGGIVAQWFSHKELPLVNGFNLSSASLGNAIGLAATVPIALALSWRAPLALYGGFALVCALAWLFFGRERPKTIMPELQLQMAQDPPISIGSVLKQKTTLILALSLVGPFALFMAIASWLPTYYNEVFNMPLARASSITALFTIFSIPAAILGGFLPMRVGLRKPFLIIPGFLICLVGLGTFMVNNPIVILISVALFGICGVIFLPSVFTLVMELPNMTPQMVTVVLAVVIAVGNLGGFLGPLVVGYLADLTGSYVPGLVLCSVLSWSLFVGGLFLPETGPRARRKV